MRRPRLSVTLLVAVPLLLPTSSAVSSAPEDPAAARWTWPVSAPIRITRGYAAPAHEYGPGHRGIDLAVGPGDGEIMAPADGVIAFAGEVGGRSIVTIDHSGGLVSTLEPVASLHAAGQRVEAGAPVGTLTHGGHTRSGEVHLGARRDGVYINPLVLLGGVPRAILLPCCAGVTLGGEPADTRP